MKKKILCIAVVICIISAVLPSSYAEEIIAEGTYGSIHASSSHESGTSYAHHWTLDDEGTFTIYDEGSDRVSGWGSSSYNKKTFYKYDGKIKNVLIKSEVRYLNNILSEMNFENIIVEADNPYYTSIDGVLYSKDKETLLIYPTDKTAEEFTVPENVKNINSKSFENCKYLQTLNLPSSLIALESDAFTGCTKLNEINVDEENSTFCSENGVVFDNTKTTLIKYPEAKKDNKYAVPNTVKAISQYAFDTVKKLRHLTLPNGLETIGLGAFKDCISLKSIDIPDSVQEIDYDAFYGCVSLKNAQLGSGLDEIKGFENCISLESVQIPEGVTGIGSSAFQNCRKLNQVAIPDSVETIERGAFKDCVSLTDVTIPNRVAVIDSNTFSGCVALTEVKGAEGITEIGEEAFAQCSKLKSAPINNKTIIIGNDAFSACTSLTSITIPKKTDLEEADQYSYIGSYAFADCTSLKEVNIPSTIDEISWGAFRGCTSLAQIDVDMKNETYFVKDGVLFERVYSDEEYDETLDDWVSQYKGDVLVQYPAGKFDETYEIPSNTIYVIANAFDSCYNLKNITIPGSVAEIEYATFYNCKNLTGVTIGNGVQVIGNSSFCMCESLESINLPDSVTEIGYLAFADNPKLYNIGLGNGVKTISEDAFGNCPSLTTVNIPASVESIDSSAFDRTPVLTEINVDENNEKYCSIDGNLFTKDKKTIVKYAEGKQDETYIIPDETTEFYSNAFDYAKNLEHVILHENITKIQSNEYTHFSNPFYGCTALTDIEVDNNNTAFASIDGNLYSKDKTRLISYAPGKSNVDFIIPDGVKIVEERAFNGSDINKLIIPASVEELNELYVDASYIEVDKDNIYYSSRDGALFDKNCGIMIKYPSLKKEAAYTVPESVWLIDSNAFSWCQNLKNITLPNPDAFINWYTVRQCDNLKDIYFGGSNAEWLYALRYDDYENRSNAKVHLTPTAQLSDTPIISKNGSKYNFNIGLEDVSGESTLVTVLYNHGVPLVKTTGLVDGDEEKTVEMSAENADNAKIFIWDSLNGMKPLCDSMHIKGNEFLVE